MSMKLFSLVLLAAFLGLATAHPHHDDKPHAHPKVVLKPIIKLPIIKPYKPAAKLPSVWAAVRKDPKFSILKTALLATGLDKVLKNPHFKGTVFAPTNAAFIKLLGKLGIPFASAIKETKFVEAVLKYHVLGAVVKSKDIPHFPKTATVPTLLPHASLTAYKKNRAVVIQAALSTAHVIKADIKAPKAIIHVIDNVLIPAAAADFPGCKSVAELATSTPALSTLVKALTAANLTSVFTDKSFNGTVLAPTNKAFNNLLKKLNTNLTALAGNTKLLTTVLTYHVIPAPVPAHLVKNKAVVPTLSGQNLKSFVGSKGIFFKGVGSTAKVIKADIFSCRGVIHVIDTVLLPKL